MTRGDPKNRCRRVVIAGQVPPPYGGQNINVARMLEVLGDCEALELLHLRVEFSKGVRNFRKFGWGKMIELIRVGGRLLRMRLSGKLDLIVFSTGGPHLMPIIRDILLLPAMLLLVDQVWIQFQAGGIAQVFDRLPSVFRGLLRFVHRRADGAIVATEWGVEDPGCLGMKEIRVIPLGMEDHGGPAAAKKGKGTTVLNVGHLSEVKGTPQLVEAFGSIAAEFPDLRLRLVGEFGDDYTSEALFETARTHGVEDRIDLIGLRSGDSLFEEYKKADLFVFSSIAYESFGMVVVEAMMCGLPVVALDWRGNREVLTDGFGGVVATFEMGRMEEGLRAGLVEALMQRDKWVAWGERNRQIYLDRYTLKSMSRNWTEFFASVMDRK